jgi:hypothetical protein
MATFALRSGISTPSIKRVWAVVPPDHTASTNMLEKIGMQRCGVLNYVRGEREACFLKPQPSNGYSPFPEMLAKTCPSGDQVLGVTQLTVLGSR